MSGKMEEEEEAGVSVAIRELTTARCWRYHQGAVDVDGGPEKPARMFHPQRTDKLPDETQDFTECGLTSLPDALCVVAPYLRTLVVRDNYLRSLPGALLSRCTALLRLDFNNNQLVSLPAELGMCTALQWLDCTYNQLTALPAELGRCTALKILQCGVNKLASLPAELGACTALERLICPNNQLSSLPAELGACTALKTLYCSGNQLSALPAELGACTALQELVCGKNQLSTLPAELGACMALQRLDCYNNQLYALPAELGACTALHDLDCSDNPFASGACTTISALREWYEQIRGRSSLIFCYEARQQSDTIDLPTHLGRIARDNVIRDIVRFVGNGHDARA